jgi:nicotinate phosphoribosyltransferase
MSFEDELTAFRNYANLYPNNATLLVDTYDTLRSGVPNAIKVFDELKASGKMPKKYGIRLDSGDLAYLSKKARKLLDNAGYPDAVIVASSDLDEYLIDSLKTQGAAINSWGVGTNLITSKDCPAFGGVYKLAAIEKDGKFIPKIKLSENEWKITNPGNKTIFRIYDKENGKMKADLIALAGEKFSEENPLMLFDPISTWKKTYLQAGEYTIRELLVPIFKDGECVYTSPKVMDIREYCQQELSTLWDETRRLVNPHKVYVDLSNELWHLKNQLLDNYNNNSHKH